MRSTKIIAPIGLACTLFGLGCAQTVPKELADARAAYDRASHGPAQELTPADLHVAETSLAEAEHAFEEEGNCDTTRDLAYIAQRRAQIAEARARTVASTREAERLTALREQSEDQKH